MSDWKYSATVSVVIPCFEAGGTIRRAVESVVCQTLMPAEIIVVDDSSEDELTESVLDSLEIEFPQLLRVIRLGQNGGPATARNEGWKAASSEYVAFLDSDDSWLPQKIETQLPTLTEHPQRVFSAHYVADGGVHSRTPQNRQSLKVVELGFKPMLFRNSVATSSVMVKASVGSRFPQGRRYAEDYSLWLQLLHSEGQGVLVQTPLAVRYKAAFGESGLSADLSKMEDGQTRVYEDLRTDGMITAHLYRALRAWALVRYCRRRFIAYVSALTRYRIWRGLGLGILKLK